MSKYELKARGKPPQSLRLTGRDGPPGITMIPGAPICLLRWTPGYWSCNLVVDHIEFVFEI